MQNSFYQPHRDEYLYLAEGHHMAWGYLEVPPLFRENGMRFILYERGNDLLNRIIERSIARLKGKFTR